MLSPKITSRFFTFLGDRFESKNYFLNFLESKRRSSFSILSQKSNLFESWFQMLEKTGCGSSLCFVEATLAAKRAQFRQLEGLS